MRNWKLSARYKVISTLIIFSNLCSVVLQLTCRTHASCGRTDEIQFPCAGKEDVKVESSDVSKDERIYWYCIHGSHLNLLQRSLIL